MNSKSFLIEASEAGVGVAAWAQKLMAEIDSQRAEVGRRKKFAWLQKRWHGKDKR